MADNKQPTFVEELVPKGSVREQLYWWQVRRKVRYICFRLQTQYDPEAPDRDAEDMPEGFREFFESQIPEPGEEPKSGQWFDGWENFGKTWDVGGKDSGFAEDKVKNPSERSDSPLVTVPRWTTVWEDSIQRPEGLRLRLRQTLTASLFSMSRKTFILTEKKTG